MKGFVLPFLLILSLLFISCLCHPENTSKRKENVLYLQPGLLLNVKKPESLDLFCFLGRVKTLVRMWETAVVKVNMDADSFDHYIGASLQDVISAYELHHNSWSVLGFASKSNSINLNPFNKSCIGIHSYSNNPYEIQLFIIRVDYWRVLMVVAGILLFLAAPKLSRNPLFYYICGVTAGICLSFLILIYFFSKLLPKKPMMYGMLIGGWTVSVYLVQLLWDNFRTVLEQYGSHVLAYITSVGILSFGFCYRFGPVTDPRSRNLIKWTLQGAALLLIFLSSWFQETTVTICIILLTVYLFPASWISKFRSFW